MRTPSVSLIEIAIGLCVVAILGVGVFYQYTAFSNPELTQTQVIFKVLGVTNDDT